MIKFIKKLKEDISFYRWVYANRKTINQPINTYIKVNNIEPKLVDVHMVVGTGELAQYNMHVRERLIKKFSDELSKILVMEENDLMNGTAEVTIRCYISPFVEE